MPNGQDPTKEFIPEEETLYSGLTIDDIEGEDDPNHQESIEAAQDQTNRGLSISGSDRRAKYDALMKNREAYTPEELSSIETFIKPRQQKQPIPYAPGMGPETQDPNDMVKTREAGQSPVEKEQEEIKTPTQTPSRSPAAIPPMEELPDLPASPAGPPVDPTPTPESVPVSKKSALETLMEQYKTAKETRDAEIEKLKEREGQLDILGTITKLGQGVGLAGTGVVPSDMDLAKDTREEIKRLQKEGKSGSQIDEYVKLMKFQQLQDQVDPDKNDPNSQISKQAQDQELAQLRALKIDHNPEEIKRMSFNALNSKKSTAYARKARSMFDIAKEGRLSSKFDLDINKEDWKRIEKREDDLIKRLNEFNNYPIVKDNMNSIAMSNTAGEILSRKNPLGDKSLVNFLAKASGERGALTEADKKPFGGSMALSSRAKQIIKDYETGTFTDENRKYVRDLVDVYKKAATRNIQKEAIRRANQFGGINFPKSVLYNKYMGLSSGAGANFDADSRGLKDYILNKNQVQEQLGYGEALTKTKDVRLLSEQERNVEVPGEVQTVIKKGKNKGRTAIFDANTKEFIRWEK